MQLRVLVAGHHVVEGEHLYLLFPVLQLLLKEFLVFLPEADAVFLQDLEQVCHLHNVGLFLGSLGLR